MKKTYALLRFWTRNQKIRRAMPESLDSTVLVNFQTMGLSMETWELINPKH